MLASESCLDHENRFRYCVSIFVTSEISPANSRLFPISFQLTSKNVTYLGASSSWSVHPLVNQTLLRNLSRRSVTPRAKLLWSTFHIWTAEDLIIPRHSSTQCKPLSARTTYTSSWSPQQAPHCFVYRYSKYRSSPMKPAWSSQTTTLFDLDQSGPSCGRAPSYFLVRDFPGSPSMRQDNVFGYLRVEEILGLKGSCMQ